jgi:hypothetical protein
LNPKLAKKKHREETSEFLEVFYALPVSALKQKLRLKIAPQRGLKSKSKKW